jgi:hypothetical protein
MHDRADAASDKATGSMVKARVLVVGAGPVGLTTALAFGALQGVIAHAESGQVLDGVSEIFEVGSPVAAARRYELRDFRNGELSRVSGVMRVGDEGENPRLSVRQARSHQPGSIYRTAHFAIP